MEFVKFNRVAPIVVDAPNLLGPNPTIWKIALEDFDEITTYSKMSPDIRILDFSDAFTSEVSSDDCYESSALQQAIKLAISNNTEVVCSVASYEEGVMMPSIKNTSTSDHGFL
jgi:hypothetical protein